MEERSRRINELTYFNAICCLSVILIHVLSYPVTNCVKPSFAAAFVFVPWKIASFVVQGFLFSGAMKMAVGFSDGAFDGYGKYLFGRLKKIVLPYAVWNVIYYAVYILTGYETFSVSAFVRHLLLGTLSVQFYYIVIAVQFYLLRPLWHVMVNNIPGIVAVPFSVIITYFSMQTDTTLAHFGIEFGYADRLFTTYLAFWVIGLYAGKNADRFTDALNRKKCWIPLAAIAVGLFVFVACVQYMYPLWLFNLSFYKMFSDILTIFLLFTLCSAIAKAVSSPGKLLRRALTFVNSASYSVYLSHCLFLNLVKKFVIDAGHSKLSVVTASSAVACIVLPFAIAYAENRIRRALTRH